MDSRQGRHIRAALALSGVRVADAARELNVSAKTLERTIRGEREIREWETARLAEVLGVPRWFLADGLDWFRVDPGGASELLDKARGLAGTVEAECIRLFAHDRPEPVS